MFSNHIKNINIYFDITKYNVPRDQDIIHLVIHGGVNINPDIKFIERLHDDTKLDGLILNINDKMLSKNFIVNRKLNSGELATVSMVKDNELVNHYGRISCRLTKKGLGFIKNDPPDSVSLINRHHCMFHHLDLDILKEFVECPYSKILEREAIKTDDPYSNSFIVDLPRGINTSWVCFYPKSVPTKFHLLKLSDYKYKLISILDALSPDNTGVMYVDLKDCELTKFANAIGLSDNSFIRDYAFMQDYHKSIEKIKILFKQFFNDKCSYFIMNYLIDDYSYFIARDINTFYEAHVLLLNHAPAPKYDEERRPDIFAKYFHVKDNLLRHISDEEVVEFKEKLKLSIPGQ